MDLYWKNGSDISGEKGGGLDTVNRRNNNMSKTVVF